MRPIDISKFFAAGTPIDAAIRRGADRAVEEHQREGRPLVVWLDGRVAWVDPVTLEEVPEPTLVESRGNDVA